MKFVLWITLFIASLSPICAQTYQWTVPVNPTDSGQITAQVVSSQGDIYLASYVSALPIPSPGFGLNAFLGNGKIRLSKLDSNGVQVWTQTFANSRGRIMDMKLDKNNDLILCGGFFDTLTLSPLTQYIGDPTYASGFISKWDTSGTLIWAKLSAAAGFYTHVSYTIETFDSLIYESGKFGSQYRIRKLNLSGNVIDSLNFSNQTRLTSDIEVDTNGYVYISGGTFSTGVIDTISVPLPPNNTGYLNFVAKLTPNLNALWVRTTNYITLDNSPQIELVGSQVALLSHDYPVVSSGLNSFNLKFYNSNGVLQHTDSLATISLTNSAGKIGLSSYPDGALVTVPIGDSILQLRRINSSYQDTLITTIKCRSWMNYPAFIYSGNFLYFTTSFYSTTAIINSIDTVFNPSGSPFLTWYTGYRELISRFDINICQPTSSVISVSQCADYTSPSGNSTWSVSGTYTDIIVNSAGCDSTITVHYTKQSSDSSFAISHCGPYTSPSGNFIWTQTGVYLDTLSNFYGCDSVLHIDFTNQESDSIFTINHCGPLLSPSGNYLWSLDGIYMDTVKNANGCDSILTITYFNMETDSTIQINSCGSYTSPSGNYTWVNSGSYLDTLMNSSGCDSLISIQLVIWNVNTTVVQLANILTASASGASFQWIDCSSNTPLIGETDSTFMPVMSGSYAVEVSQNGCVDTSSCYTVLNVNINEISPASIRIYPIPSDGNLIIESDFKWTQLKVFDFLGKEVYSSLSSYEGIRTEIQLPYLVQGSYLLRLTNGEESVNKVIIIK